MFRNSCQRGRLTIFYSVGSKPLNNWEIHCKHGYITRFLDPDIKSMVLEIGGVNVSTTYMTCPAGNKVLGITMPYLIMVVKNMKKYFTFEVTILDETGTRRRFRVANFQSQTQILPLSTVMPINLTDGWNQIQFNLYEFTRRAYNKHFVEVQKIKINANIRVRRIYFAEKLVSDEELPTEYKIYYPLKSQVGPKVAKTPSASIEVHASDQNNNAKRSSKNDPQNVETVARRHSSLQKGRRSTVEFQSSHESITEKLIEPLIRKSIDSISFNSKVVTQVQTDAEKNTSQDDVTEPIKKVDSKVSTNSIKIGTVDEQDEVEHEDVGPPVPPASSVMSNAELDVIIDDILDKASEVVGEIKINV